MPQYDQYGNPLPEEEKQYDQYGSLISEDKQYDQYGQPLHVVEPRPAQPPPPVDTSSAKRSPLLIGLVIVVILFLCGGGAAVYLLSRGDASTPEATIALATATPTAKIPTATVAPPTLEPSPTPEPPTPEPPTPEPPTSEPLPTESGNRVLVPTVVVPSPQEAAGLSTEEVEALRQEVETAINNHNRLRVEGLLTNDSEKFKQIKTGEELKYQLSNINYYIATNSYWDIQLKEMIIDSFIIHDPQHVEVALTKLETGRFYNNDSTEPDPEKSYYDDHYSMGYVMEKIDGAWYVTKITGVKDREY